jgi:predicted DNA-binding transcriptional regulator
MSEVKNTTKRDILLRELAEQLAIIQKYKETGNHPSPLIEPVDDKLIEDIENILKHLTEES